MKHSGIREIATALKSRISLRYIQATMIDGVDTLPVKFAEAFGFGRAKK
jgi:hypothetical protein